jgi:tripartite-type tricarboxylate transporter receptor subunit TctC
VAPAKTPSEIVAKINSDTRLALADPSIKQRLAQLSVEVAPSSPGELATLLKNEIDKWGKVIKEASIKPE